MNNNSISTGTTDDDMMYHVLISYYPQHEISLIWNECTSMQLVSQWGYVYCKSFSKLAVVQ